MTNSIAEKVNLDFSEVNVGPKTFVIEMLEHRAVGVYRLNMEDRNIVTGDLDVLDKGKGYARPLIEYVIGLLSSKPAVHCEDLTTEEARERLPHIFKEHGYEEIERGFLRRDYSKNTHNNKTLHSFSLPE